MCHTLKEMSKKMTSREVIKSAFPDMTLLPEEYDNALLGVVSSGKVSTCACYSKFKLLEIIRKQMNPSESNHFLDFCVEHSWPKDIYFLECCIT